MSINRGFFNDMTFIDTTLRRADKQRKEACFEALTALQDDGLKNWTGFGDPSRVLFLTGGTGQIHVGDAFRASESFDYLRKKGYRIILATSPGMAAVFAPWADMVRVIDAQRSPEEIVADLRAFGVESRVKWAALLRAWRKNLSAVFDEAAVPVLRSAPLEPDCAETMALRHYYSDGHRKPVLGIVWRTSMIGRNPARNASLETFLPLIRLGRKGWSVVSLQYGNRDLVAHELAAFHSDHKDRILLDDSVDPMRDYGRAAAQMAACDYVVSIDCSQVLQAAAFGVPSSVLLCTKPHSQWGETGRISPFFSGTLELCRQTKKGDWKSPVERAKALALSRLDAREAWSHAAARRIKDNWHGQNESLKTPRLVA